MSRERADLRGLGTFIRRRRLELGLTQTQLGHRIGYYQERISSLERGTYGLPSLPALEELAQALECALMDLLCACGYIGERDSGFPTEVRGVSRDGQFRSNVLQVHQGISDLQLRLSATESAMAQMQDVRERMRVSRQSMNEGIRECLKVLS